MHVVTSCTLKSDEKRFKLTEREFSGSVAGMKTRTLANTPPPASGFALYHEGGNIRALDANGKVHRLRPERGTPVHAVAASATLDPAGADNSVVLTRDEAGSVGSLAAEIATPGQVDISVGFDGVTVSISAGTKHNMTVAGTLSPDATGTLLYAGMTGETKIWSTDGMIEPPAEGEWVRLAAYGENGPTPILSHYTDSSIDGAWTCGSTGAEWPDDDTYTADAPATGTATVTASAPTAAQVVAAVNASEIPFTASGSGSGTVAATTAAFSGGSNATEAAAGDQLFDDDNRYLAISDVRKSSTSGWITEPYPS